MIRTRKPLVGSLASALLASPLALGAAAPAHAAEVPIRLLNINDFHGRIDANTAAFATTVERQRAEAGDANTLLLSAGDNIGASLFASATQQDQPTIDVLNALELRGSAVGNHEFDKGIDDLTGRVSEAAAWDHLGANVYQEGTTDPVLDEYTTAEIGDLTVGIIGAVTMETPSLVSPSGVEGLEFGDPVEAVNRVAAQLSDGDDSNGEADVLVAEYHEGAPAGTPDGSTLEEEVAAGGAFADIVTGTAPQVDVIYTGHTHKQYAWDAPVPGAEGTTRPVVQTGSYGEFVGQVDLTVDSETGQVTAYSAENVARAAEADTSLPRVAEVDDIVQAALEHAAEVGNQPVGKITADVTTAFNEGARDDRSAESTLGGLVANALRDGVSDLAEVDLGITNPGGLRAELLHAGDVAQNPANEDGVLTYAEANAVLPFNNTVSLGEMTGAEIVAVLEQQWQPASASRPYLQLGLSENVSVTADALAPEGERITSVRVDGELIDPAGTYTVSTLSFLASGGDNFTAFQDGEWTDTGLLDAELWRTYLADNSPIAPDFARQQVFTAGMPTELAVGETSTFALGPDVDAPTQPYTGETLDLTSLGAPANTSVAATGTTAEGELVELGSFPVESGTAEVALDVPAALAGGQVLLVAQPSGTTVTLAVGDASLEPASLHTVVPPVRQGKTGKVIVEVTGAESTPIGTVDLLDGEQTLATAPVEDGVAQLRFATDGLDPGQHTLTVAYSGDQSTGAVQQDVTLTVKTAPGKPNKPGKPGKPGKP